MEDYTNNDSGEEILNEEKVFSTNNLDAYTNEKQNNYFYYSNEDRKSYLIYDISNFAMVLLCLSCVGYFIFVPLQGYNWIVLLSLILFSTFFGIIAFTTKVEIPRTLFSKMTNSLFENISYDNIFEFIKIFSIYIFKSFKYLFVIYTILLLLSYLNILQIFAYNYIPYPFHSNCKDFDILMLSIFLIVTLICLFKFKVKLLGEIIGIILLYTFFDEQFFDMLATSSGFIGECLICLFFVILGFKLLKIFLSIFFKCIKASIEIEREKEIKKEAIKELLKEKNKRRW